tara:strand:+ start:612 stop:1997 length:1386 start_codon:yes stop_codon:yes gene_type:complete
MDSLNSYVPDSLKYIDNQYDSKTHLDNAFPGKKIFESECFTPNPNDINVLSPINDNNIEKFIINSNLINTNSNVKFKELGPYKDTGNRALRYGPKKYGYNAKTCAKATKGYKYFALQNNGWCCADNDLSHATKYGKSNTCKYGKKGIGNGGKLGGPWCNYIYEKIDNSKLVVWNNNRYVVSKQIQTVNELISGEQIINLSGKVNGAYISNKGNTWNFINLDSNQTTSTWLGYLYDGGYTKFFHIIFTLKNNNNIKITCLSKYYPKRNNNKTNTSKEAINAYKSSTNTQVASSSVANGYGLYNLTLTINNCENEYNKLNTKHNKLYKNHIKLQNEYNFEKKLKKIDNNFMENSLKIFRKKIYDDNNQMNANFENFTNQNKIDELINYNKELSEKQKVQKDKINLIKEKESSLEKTNELLKTSTDRNNFKKKIIYTLIALIFLLFILSLSTYIYFIRDFKVNK